MQGAALVGMVVIGVMFLSEMRRWRSITSIIGRRQRITRVWLTVLIEALFVMMFVGPWVTSDANPIGALIYWTLCLALILAVLVLAWQVWRGVAQEYNRLNRQLFSDLLRDEEREK